MTKPMKDSGVEWIGEIPADWNVSKLKYVIKLNQKSLKDNTPDDYEFNYVDIGSVTLEKGIEKYEMTTFSEAPSRAKRIVEKGDIIVSTVRTYLKAIAKIDEAENLIVSTGFAVLTPSKIHETYLEFFCKSDYFSAKVSSESVGVSYPAINSSDLINIPILCPPEEEQRKIATFLDDKTSQIDSIIDNTKQSIVEFKKYKQALITETVTKGLNPDAKMTDSGIKLIGKIPDYWEINKLKTAGSFFSAGVDKKIRENENLYKSVHYTDVYYNSLKQIKNSEDYLVISAAEDKAKKSNLLKGDVLFTTSSETPEDIGHSTVVEEDLTDTLMGYHLIRFRADEGMVLSYKKYAFGSSHLRNWFAYRANGMTRYGLKVVDFLDAPYIIIPKKEQQQIADFLDEKCAHIDSLIADKEKLISEFEDYKKSLIYEYVTGKKAVE